MKIMKMMLYALSALKSLKKPIQELGNEVSCSNNNKSYLMTDEDDELAAIQQVADSQLVGQVEVMIPHMAAVPIWHQLLLYDNDEYKTVYTFAALRRGFISAISATYLNDNVLFHSLLSIT